MPGLWGGGRSGISAAFQRCRKALSDTLRHPCGLIRYLVSNTQIKCSLNKREIYYKNKREIYYKKNPDRLQSHYNTNIH